MTDRDDLVQRTIATVEDAFARGIATPEGRAAFDRGTHRGGSRAHGATLTSNGRRVDPETGAIDGAGDTGDEDELAGDDGDTGTAPPGEPSPRRPTLVYGQGPELRATLPAADRFRDSGGHTIDFCRAHELQPIARALMGRWDELAHCEELRLAYLWRRKAQAKAGKLVLGTCQKLSGIAKALLEADWAITLNAENCRAAQLTRSMLEALVYHELSHIGPPEVDEATGEETEPALVGHDIEMFNLEVARYGLWKQDLALTAQTFEQLRLWGVK